MRFMEKINMNMRKKITAHLKRMLKKLKLRNFYLPDGYSTGNVNQRGAQTCDRLLIIMSGVKNEPMSLNRQFNTIRLKKGDFYLIRKNVWEYSAFDSKHDFFCIIPRDGFLRLVYYPIRKPQTGHVPWPENEWIHTGAPVPESILHAFEILKSPEAQTNHETAAECLRLILRLAISEAGKKYPPRGKALRCFERMNNFIEFNFTSPITREDVAKHFGMTPTYISQLFKQFTGRPFIECLTSYRMQLAKRLLAETDTPIKNIAEECGFGNQVYFIRRFRELYGCSPGKYRIANEISCRRSGT